MANPTDPDRARPKSQIRAEFQWFLVIFDRFRPIVDLPRKQQIGVKRIWV